MSYLLTLRAPGHLDGYSPLTFALDKSTSVGASTQMIYVVNIEDGGGQEFFLTAEGKLVSLTLPDQEEPQEFRSIKQALKKMDLLRPKYPKTCRIYALERTEFTNRRKLLQTYKE